MIAFGLFRWLCHTLSGVIFFADYAPAGDSVFLYSLGYNTFVLVDILVAIVAAIPVYAGLKTREVKNILARHLGNNNEVSEDNTRV